MAFLSAQKDPSCFDRGGGGGGWSGDRDQAANFKPGLISSAESKTRK